MHEVNEPIITDHDHIINLLKLVPFVFSPDCFTAKNEVCAKAAAALLEAISNVTTKN